MIEKAISPEIVKSMLAYEAESGTLRWLHRQREMFKDEGSARAWNSRYAGKVAFTSVSSAGYLKGAIFNRYYSAHRVAWAIASGSWPEGQIDHINGNRRDNRLANLREATPAQNCRNRRLPSNSTSGVLGVSWHISLKKWQAHIRQGGRYVYLGTFDDIEDAIKARAKANKDFGYHPNHGRAA